MPEDDSILESRDGSVLILTINRPHRANALDRDSTIRLKQTFAGLAEDRGDVRALVLRGEGKHFCSGADIGGAGDRGGRPPIGHMVRSLHSGPHALIETLWDCPLPTVAELKGRTSGMGLHMALACDFTVAAPGSSFAEPFSDRGFNVDSGGSWLLPRMIGLTRAKQLLYLAEPIDGATAVAWGLVSEVADDPSERALELARRLGQGPTFALGVAKRLLHDGLGTDLGAALRSEAAGVELSIRSSDFKEGMKAFVEKRPPEFEGN